ncbi:ATP-binding protein [Corynebacterium liangguodongii]|uniref:ATP-binding protein n=2 Tax=Corynebacterium liangguodongii TaxID=2079535 RepID=A0A2S0WCE6_9CORY|nr:ATP-binding protein [Corynebacterium liangguodongii]PWC00477.1 ATP-binding protein [Corynebacterium liangguodongii]
MRLRRAPCENRGMPDQTASLYPRYVRSRPGRVVAGVAAGLSSHLGVEVSWVRVFFALASFAGGLGPILYAALWALAPLRDGTAVRGAGSWPRWVNTTLVAVSLAGVLVSVSLASGLGAVFTFIVGVVAVGAVVAWQAYDRDLGSKRNVAALAAGIALVMSGVLAIAVLGENAGLFGIVAAVLSSVFGVLLLVVPLIVRLATSLVAEREAKAAADQRAEIASKLHDSVLQTLALIQKRAGDPAEVSRLARGQERELRSWLFDGDGATKAHPATVFTALTRAAGEVEDLFSVIIRPVTVGEDVAYTEGNEAIVLAAREAMVNAGKHSGADAIDVYAEHLAGRLSVFVRDRGRGFDVGAVPADRHGVSESIVARMERAGGSASVTSAPGEGTEVELSLPA